MRDRARLFYGVLLLALAVAAPAWARDVLLTAAAPLADHSDGSMERAIRSAVDTCVRSATAMGFAWIRLRDAAVSENAVVVQMVAGDEEPDGDDDVTVLDVVPRAESGQPGAGSSRSNGESRGEDGSWSRHASANDRSRLRLASSDASSAASPAVRPAASPWNR